ncbi:hypothetical protein WJX74_005895 [Apatococcus lobatus]|uniref:Uncharacterized protein n=2 Tax=Apatococcus TaxID=904362 RepID=A0AAW1T9Q6_9CHLO
MAQGRPKEHLKTPEGLYQLFSERRGGLVSFKPERLPKLAIAEGLSRQKLYILHAVAEVVEVCDYGACDKTALRHICASSTTLPTCIAYYPAADSYDLLIGLNTGEVMVVKLATQLEAAISNNRALNPIIFSADAAGDASKLVSVAWIPTSRGCTFVAAHASGSVFVYPKGSANMSEGSGSMKGSKGSQGRPPATEIRVPGGVTSAAVSPDGACIATAGVDGVMRIYSMSGGGPTAGFKSYYGGLLCVAWSHDGRYIATGGEDDLISIYGVLERSVVVWGQGHTSWVAAVAFDTELNQVQSQQEQARVLRTMSGNPCSGDDAVYRLGSVGQDGQLLLWDISVPSFDYQLSSSPAMSGASRQGPASPSRGRYGSSPSSARGYGPQEFPLLDSSSSSPGSQAGISPAVARVEMTFCSPATAQRVSTEPLSDLLFTEHAVFVTDQVGAMRCWRRPPGSEAPSPQHSPGQVPSAERASPPEIPAH